MKILFPTALVWFYVEYVLTSDCYWNNRCSYNLFSSKTPYEFVRGDIRDSIIKQKDCEPVSIWALIRHGQRYPGTFGKPMRSVLVVNMDMFDKPNQLTKEGYRELKDIGRRLKQAFPKLLENLENNNYLIRPARGQWVEDSAIGFIDGLNDKQLTVQSPKTDFDVIAPYLTCRKYQDLKKKPEIYAESEKYLTTSEYLYSKDRIQRRLGINYSLTDVNITALYDLCRYTSSGQISHSPWCALFTTKDLKAMEYIADLRQYYRNGYGTPMNELFGQITLTNLLKTFQDAKSEKGKKITAYLTHATMMDMVYTSLQLFKDDVPLTASLRNPDRKWRSSRQSVLYSNLIVVLNKCNNGTTDYNVVFYMNEEPLQSICKEGVCTWTEFEDKLSSFVNTNTDFCG